MTQSLQRLAISSAVTLALSLPFVVLADSGDNDEPQVRRVIEMPLIPGWYDGKKIAYLQTEVSDPDLAVAQQSNYVPKLALVLQAQGVSYDDIYAVTNFKQSNIVPSAPIPAGPKNADPNYSPLWQLSKVTWANPKKAHILKSEAEVLAAASAKLVTVEKTEIVVNCSIIRSPQGGTLPGASIESERH